MNRLNITKSAVFLIDRFSLYLKDPYLSRLFEHINVNIFLSVSFNICFGTILLSTKNICFGLEKRNLFFNSAL